MQIVPPSAALNAALSAAPIDPLLTNREVATLIGVKSVVTVWRRVQDGTLPKPIAIGGTRRWPRSEILAFIEKAKSARSVAERAEVLHG